MARGRPRSTTRQEVARIALGLFNRSGFDETTVEDIAAALGVGRRTLFRYFESKNDMVWGDFDWVLQRLRSELASAPADASLMDALRQAAVSSNTYPADQLPELQIRMTLITTVPALQAHSMLRYAEWRAVVAEFAAERLDKSPNDFVPVALGHAALAASVSAFTHWVTNPNQELLDLLDRSYRLLAEGFDEVAVDRLARGI